MKIAIYIDNRKINNVNCSDLLRGNPGIGGTEYCVLLLAQALKRYSRSIHVLLIAEKTAIFPDVDEVKIAKGLDEVVKAAKTSDILVLSSRREGKPYSKDFFNRLEQENINTILWGHNYYYSDYCDLIAESKAIKANVFVGKQQYDRYIDHKIIKKSTYIYNMYPMQGKKKRSEKTEHVVTYIGSLVPEKGFQVLAEAWKDILRAVPDAQLNVIGSGKLYARDSKLGRYGIAEEKFENEFMSKLLDDNKCLLPSVHFLGVLGAEKDDVILKTNVGVVNPTGRTETFGIGALDFESMGVPVVTIRKGGFLDTVVDQKTGILVKKTSDIAGAVVNLLLDERKNITYGEDGRKLAMKFNPEIITENWISLFLAVKNKKAMSLKKPNNFMSDNLKWLRVANYNVKNCLRIEKGFSVIGLETRVKYILGRISR